MFEYAFAERALVAAVTVGLLCGLLGFFVILRRLAFIGVGISHAAVGGVALGVLLGVDPALSAAAFSVAVALGMFWVARDRRLGEDAVIGVFLSGAMALGLLLMSLGHGYQKDLFSYLFGSLPARSSRRPSARCCSSRSTRKSRGPTDVRSTRWTPCSSSFSR